MDVEAIERAHERLAAPRPHPADVLEQARRGLEELALATAALPEQVGAAVKDEARPLARSVAEIRGLMNQVIRRLERLEGDMLAERNARVDDLALLVDLVTSGWKSVDDRLERLEQHFHAKEGAVVYRIEERR
jgi:hypothetical protein